MTTDKQRATHLLQHYLHLAVTASGNRWDGDNQSEVAEIVDSIIAACTPAGSPSPSSATPSTPSTPSTAATLDHAGDMLTRFAQGQPIGAAHKASESTLLIASMLYAVATELHDIADELQLTRLSNA